MITTISHILPYVADTLKAYYYVMAIVLTVIGRWHILDNEGIKGWKALIPCYRNYALGQTCKEEKLGRKVCRLGVILLAVCAVFLLALIIAVGTDNAENEAVLGFEVVFGAGIAVFALYYIFQLGILKHKYILYNKADEMWLVAWMILEWAGEMYFGLIYKSPKRNGIV